MVVLVRYISDLNEKTARFARHCVEKYTFVELVHSSKDGIDYVACDAWGLTGEEWQDAIFAALKELRVEMHGKTG
ncbi:hypothetical protein [Desulfuromonas acetoxidans]|uniref:hypothetical protein n=1 Tax=Desulfuromonas acetoxidans TaxID=891 RepID=UPI003747D5C5